MRKLYRRGGRIKYYANGGMYGNNTVPGSMIPNTNTASYEQVNQAQIDAANNQLAQIKAQPWQQQFAQQQQQGLAATQALNQSATKGLGMLTDRLSEGKNVFGKSAADLATSQGFTDTVVDGVVTETAASKAGNLAGNIGTAGMVADFAGQGLQKVSDDGDATKMNVGETSGTMLSGAGKGASMGATIGSIVPGVGTAIGAGVGATIGAVTSGLKGRKARNEAREMEEEEEMKKAQAQQGAFAGGLQGKEYSGSNMGQLKRGGYRNFYMGGGPLKYAEGGNKVETDTMNNWQMVNGQWQLPSHDFSTGPAPTRGYQTNLEGIDNSIYNPGDDPTARMYYPKRRDNESSEDYFARTAVHRNNRGIVQRNAWKETGDNIVEGIRNAPETIANEVQKTKDTWSNLDGLGKVEYVADRAKFIPIPGVPQAATLTSVGVDAIQAGQAALEGDWETAGNELVSGVVDTTFGKIPGFQGIGSTAVNTVTEGGEKLLKNTIQNSTKNQLAQKTGNYIVDQTKRNLKSKFIKDPIKDVLHISSGKYEQADPVITPNNNTLLAQNRLGGVRKYQNGGGQGNNPDLYTMSASDAAFINAKTGAREGDQAYQSGSLTMPNLISSDRQIPSNIKNLNLPTQSSQPKPIDFRNVATTRETLMNAPENNRQANLNQKLDQTLEQREITPELGMGFLDTAQLGLAGLGMIPGFGVVPDLLNAGISGARGKYGDMAINLAAATPGVGLLAGPAAIGNKTYKTLKTVKNFKSAAQVPKIKFTDKLLNARRNKTSNPQIQYTNQSESGQSNPAIAQLLSKRTGGVRQLDGGVAKPLPGGATEFVGKKHEQGGIKLDPMTEVEGGETMDKIKGSDYFFSSYLKLGGKSFAQRHKDILKQGGSQEELDRLAAIQEKAAGRSKYNLGGERTKFKNGGPDLTPEELVKLQEYIKSLGPRDNSIMDDATKIPAELKDINPALFNLEGFSIEDLQDSASTLGLSLTEAANYMLTPKGYSFIKGVSEEEAKIVIGNANSVTNFDDYVYNVGDNSQNAVVDNDNPNNASDKKKKSTFTGLYNNVTDTDIADYLDEAAAITGLETFDPRNKEHVKLLQTNLMNPSEELKTSYPTYFSGKETDILEGDLGVNQQGVDSKFGIDTLNALKQFSELESNNGGIYNVLPGEYDPSIYTFNPELDPTINKDPNDEYQYYEPENEPVVEPASEENEKNKGGDLLKKLGKSAVPILGAGLQLLPAYMAFKEKPDYMNAPGRLPTTHLDRVRFNAEREQNEGNYRGMGRMIEQSGMGPAGIAAKMASWGKKQAQDVQIGGAEARANAQIQQQESALNQGAQKQNIANSMQVNQFNKAADAATKDRKLMAVQNAVQSIAGMGSDYMQYKAQDDLARAIGGQTPILDNFYIHELDFQKAYPDMANKQGSPEYSGAFASYLKKIQNPTKAKKRGGYRELYKRGGRKKLKKC